jgi:hypothetical protein
MGRIDMRKQHKYGNGYTFSNARLKTKGSYGVDGIRFSEYQGGLYHLRRPPATIN